MLLASEISGAWNCAYKIQHTSPIIIVTAYDYKYNKMKIRKILLFDNMDMCVCICVCAINSYSYK